MKKNNYCSNLYNETVKERARGHQTSAQLLSINLSVQLLSMDLWSHRIYSGTFVQTLEEAVKFNFTEENKYYKLESETLDSICKKINDRKLEVGQARLLLLAHQTYLEDQLSK